MFIKLRPSTNADGWTAYQVSFELGLVIKSKPGVTRIESFPRPFTLELAYLRALQEIAFLLHDDELDGRALWREVAQRLDDVISAVDRALSADVAAGRRAA